MDNLNKKINQLEYSIHNHRKLLAEDLALLQEEAKTTKFLTMAMIGGFAFGYMLAPKKNSLPSSASMGEKMSNIASLLTKAYKNIKLILPLIMV
jgi:hypothetical protein